jgi:hypothetical protein
VSGVAPDYPVPLEDNGANGRLLQNPNSWVTWWRTGQWIVPVRWRTELSGDAPDCPVRPSLADFPNCYLVVEGYKYPQPPQLQASKFSEVLIQYKS